MTKDEALRLALEAFNDLAAWNDGEVGSHMDEPYSAEIAREAITAIKEALAQPEQDLVEWGVDWGPDGNSVSIIKRLADGGIEVVGWEYAPHPPQRTWVGLTDEEIWQWFRDNTALTSESGKRIYQAIEAKLKDKNT
jgi:hypothetical protein